MRPDHSITTTREIRAVYERGGKARRDGVTAHVLGRSDRRRRLALAVPASVGSAVVRNRIRRRVRAAFRAAGPGPGVDVVVRPAASAAGIDFQELVVSLDEAIGVARERAR